MFLFSLSTEEGDDELHPTPHTPTIQRRVIPKVVQRRKMSFPAVSISAPQVKQQVQCSIF